MWKIVGVLDASVLYIYQLKAYALHSFIINLYNIITKGINCIGVTKIKYKMITPQ